MIVCLCEGLNEHQLKRAIDGGATTLRSLGAKTGAGTHCGSCRCDLKRMLEDAARGACTNLPVAAAPAAK